MCVCECVYLEMHFNEMNYKEREIFAMVPLHLATCHTMTLASVRMAANKLSYTANIGVIAADISETQLSSTVRSRKVTVITAYTHTMSMSLSQSHLSNTWMKVKEDVEKVLVAPHQHLVIAAENGLHC